MSHYSPIVGRRASDDAMLGSASEPLLGLAHRRPSRTRHTWLDPVRKRKLLRSLSVDMLLEQGEMRGSPIVKSSSVPHNVKYEALQKDGTDEDDSMSFVEALREVFGQGKHSLILATIMLNTVTANILIAFVAPFFPLEAEKRYQASSTVVGLILAGYPLAVMTSAPFWAMLTPWLGRTYLYTVGSIILAIGTLLFPFAPSSTVCFALRIVQGLGSSAAGTTSLAMCSDLFPDYVGFVTGLSEVAIGLGFFIGPPIGSLLHSIGDEEVGYMMPFVTMAVLLFVQTVGFIVFARSEASTLDSTEERDSHGNVGYRELISTPLVLTVCATCVACTTYTFAEPTLEKELMARLHVTDAQKGILFGLPALPYAIGSPIAGGVTKKYGCKPIMICGLLGHGFSFLLMGPAPFLERMIPALGSIQAQWFLKVLTMCTFGLSSAFAVIPTYPDLHQGIEHLGPAAVDRAAGIFTMAYSMGEVLGPILGGLGFEAFGFAGECTVVSIATAGYGIFLLVLVMAKVVPKSGTEFDADEMDTDATDPRESQQMLS